MTYTDVVTANSWEEFKDFIERYKEKHSQHAIFRGQGSSKYHLQTSLHRIHPEVDLEKYLEEVNKTKESIETAYGNKYNTNTDEEIFSFLSLLQHHGYPTPLLDWSKSPYIACYFAFSSIPKNEETGYVAIYFFIETLWNKFMNHILANKDRKYLNSPFKYIHVIRPEAGVNKRIKPQRGLFTITNMNYIEELVRHDWNKSGHSQEVLTKIIIPTKEREKVLKELDQMGINQMSLFPGLDGACAYFKEKITEVDINEAVSLKNYVY